MRNRYNLSWTELLNEFIHKSYKLCFVNKNSRWSGNIFLDVVEETGRMSKDQEYIKYLIRKSTPLFIGRLGAVEMTAFLNYLQINNKLPNSEQFKIGKYYLDKVLPNWWSVGSQRSMCNNAGFFPASPENLTKWGVLMEKDIKDVDILLRWLKNEKLLLPLNMNMNFLAYRNIEYPFLFLNPYIEALEGMKVLVISPFSETIKHQYELIDKIWSIKAMCPKYELKTLQSYNILRGNNKDADVRTWFDALKKMEEKISNIDFDIALIGCGAYAFHLGAFIKRMGKKAITTCGSTQLLFGIYGNRWVEFLKEKGIYNGYWTRPFDTKPKGYEKVENAAYW